MESSNSSKGNLSNTKQIPPAKWWCFTLNNYNDDDINDILTICSNSSIKYVFQEETGDEGTKHLQGVIEFNKKLRPKGLFINKGIHWEKTKNTKASIAYCCKEETRTGKIFTNLKLPKPLKLINPKQFFEWQIEIYDIIKEEADDRTIYWYWSEDGGVGKSIFSKYLCAKEDAVLLSGKAADMKYGILAYKNKHDVYPETIIIDVPRSNVEFLSYTGIEEIKNGCFFSTKYESDMVIFNNPHIIIFANEEPNYEKMSADRWCVKEITQSSPPLLGGERGGDDCSAI